MCPLYRLLGFIPLISSLGLSMLFIIQFPLYKQEVIGSQFMSALCQIALPRVVSESFDQLSVVPHSLFSQSNQCRFPIAGRGPACVGFGLQYRPVPRLATPDRNTGVDSPGSPTYNYVTVP